MVYAKLPKGRKVLNSWFSMIKPVNEYISKINLVCVQSSDDITFFGAMIYKGLIFKKHVNNLCRKTQYRLDALRDIRRFLTGEKAKSLGNAFIESQFNYPLLIWAFRRKTFYSKNGKNRYKTSKAVNAIDDS